MSNNKPYDQVRIGTIIAAIWKNETDSGIRYNITLQRMYRKNDQWAYTDQLRRDDLLLASKVLDQAHTRISKLQQNDK